MWFSENKNLVWWSWPPLTFHKQWFIYGIEAIGVFLLCYSFSGHMRCWQLVTHWRQMGSWDRVMDQWQASPWDQASWETLKLQVFQLTVYITVFKTMLKKTQSASQSLSAGRVVFRSNSTWKYVKKKKTTTTTTTTKYFLLDFGQTLNIFLPALMYM